MTSTTPEPGPGPPVRADIQHARLDRIDERGLMPLEEARAWLAGRDAYAKGAGTLIDGTYVLESDRTWAALLSLADGEAFLAQARRLTWEFEAVRGDSPDLVLAVEALRERRAITRSVTGTTRDDNIRARINAIGGYAGA